MYLYTTEFRIGSVTTNAYRLWELYTCLGVECGPESELPTLICIREFYF